MKKIVVCTALVLLAVAAAFAAPPLKLSAGAGALFAGDFGGGVKMNIPGASMEIKTPWYGGGAYVFLMPHTRKLPYLLFTER